MKKALLKTGKEYSLETQGSNDYGIAASNIIGGATSLTVCGWVKKMGGGGTYEVAIHSSVNQNIGQSDFFLGFHTTGDQMIASIGAKTSGWSNGSISTYATIGQWYHLCACWDGSTVKIYLDGVYQKQYNMGTSFVPYTTAPTRLGASSNGTVYQFNGIGRDYRLYDRALSADEVLLVKKGISISKEGLLAHWDCNKLKSDGTLPDLSGNGYDMTLSGATLVADTP